MSRGVRIFLGIVLVACAAGSFALVPWMRAVSDAAGPGMFGLGVFCAIGAIACFSPRSRPLTIRIIGLVVFGVCAAYLVSQARQMAVDPTVQNLIGDRQPTSLWGSLRAMLLFGLPGAYAAITGRIPLWSMFAGAFGTRDEPATSR